MRALMDTMFGKIMIAVIKLCWLGGVLQLMLVWLTGSDIGYYAAIWLWKSRWTADMLIVGKVSDRAESPLSKSMNFAQLSNDH
jgi:hypothetical protein